MSEAAYPQPNTFNTARYDHNTILARLKAHGEIVLARDHSIVAAHDLEREGLVSVRWEGPWLIVRKAADGKPGPRPVDGGDVA